MEKLKYFGLADLTKADVVVVDSVSKTVVPNSSNPYGQVIYIKWACTVPVWRVISMAVVTAQTGEVGAG